MACSPSGPAAYRILCLFSQYILSTIIAGQGLWLLYNARRLSRTTSKVAPEMSGGGNSGGLWLRRLVYKMSHVRRLTIVHGFKLLCISGSLALGGYGTTHSTATTAGQLSDLLIVIAMAGVMYHSSLHRQGAQEFRIATRVSQPNSSGARINVNVKRAGIQWSDVCSFVNGPGTLLLAVGLWALALVGVIARWEMYSVVVLALLGTGVRSLFHNILSRVRTLVQLQRIRQHSSCRPEAKRKQREGLMKQARVLMIEIIFIPTSLLLLPLSILAFGSIHSSLRWLIHNVVFLCMLIVVWSVTGTMTHNHVNAWLRQIEHGTQAPHEPNVSSPGESTGLAKSSLVE
jgi:hypothetical protein